MEGEAGEQQQQYLPDIVRQIVLTARGLEDEQVLIIYQSPDYLGVGRCKQAQYATLPFERLTDTAPQLLTAFHNLYQEAARRRDSSTDKSINPINVYLRYHALSDRMEKLADLLLPEGQWPESDYAEELLNASRGVRERQEQGIYDGQSLPSNGGEAMRAINKATFRREWDAIKQYFEDEKDDVMTSKRNLRAEYPELNDDELTEVWLKAVLAWIWSDKKNDDYTWIDDGTKWKTGRDHWLKFTAVNAWVKHVYEPAKRALLEPWLQFASQYKRSYELPLNVGLIRVYISLYND
jgi:hypothetical protein